MNDCISFVVEFGIKPGNLDKFRALGRELVAAAQANEPGTLIFEYFLSEDGTTCQLFERYADSPAALQHLGTLKEKYLERVLSVTDVNRLVIYGSPTPDLHRELSGLGAEFLPQMDGFSR